MIKKISLIVILLLFFGLIGFNNLTYAKETLTIKIATMSMKKMTIGQMVIAFKETLEKISNG